MSRWLKSVNNLLENLDGTVETAAAEAGEVVSSSTAGLIGGATRRFAAAAAATAGGRQEYTTNSSEDDDDDDDEYYDDDDDEDYSSKEEDENNFTPDDTTDDQDPREEVSLQPLDESFTAHSIAQAEAAAAAAITAPSATSQESLATTTTTTDNGGRPHLPITTESVNELSFPEEPEEQDVESSPPPQVKEEPVRIANAAVIDGGRSNNTSGRQNNASAKNVSSYNPPVASSTTGTDPKLSSTSTTTKVKAAAAPPPLPLPKPSPPASPTTKGASKQPPPASTALQHSNINNKLKTLQTLLEQSQKDLSTVQRQNHKLEQKVSTLESTVSRNERELEAQAKELQQAGRELENIRTTAKEDQEDILEEHDEELEEMQKQHQIELDQLRGEYERTIAEWKERFEVEQTKRQQEGGNWNQELEDAIQREKVALTQLSQVTTDQENLQRRVAELEGTESDLQTELQEAVLATEAAMERERSAHDELDQSKDVHSRQLAQRQRREHELEQTVSELGAALSLAKQQQQLSQQNGGGSTCSSSHNNNNNHNDNMEAKAYKDQWEQAMEDVEALKVQLTMEQERRKALQEEFQDVSTERTRELELEQARHDEADRKIAELESTIANLRAATAATSGVPSASSTSGRSNSKESENDLGGGDVPTTTNAESLLQQNQHQQRELAKLSEQILKHQQQAELSKSELLALKGRLRAATARAEKAEEAPSVSQQQQSNGGRLLLDVEAAGGSPASYSYSQSYTARRRIKGQHRGGGMQGVRSIRSALRLGPVGIGGNAGSSMAHSSSRRQIVMTVDAVDRWMVGTGYFLRHEPLARLGFLLYLATLHLWTFALVVFHTTEVEHGDFGSMDSNPRHWRKG